MNQLLTISMLRDLLRSQPDHDLIPDQVLKMVILEVELDVENLKERILSRCAHLGLIEEEYSRACFLIGVATGAAIAIVMM